MPRATQKLTADQLKGYTVVSNAKKNLSHSNVITGVRHELDQKGYTIDEESYKANADLTMVSAIFTLSHPSISNTDYKPVFTWFNADNDNIKFQCAAGVSDGNSIFIHNSVKDKKGVSDKGVSHDIQECVASGIKGFDTINSLRSELDGYQQKLMTEETMAESLGKLFVIDRTINKVQVGVVRDDIINGISNFYEFAKSITGALSTSHPSKHIGWNQHSLEAIKTYTGNKVEPIETTDETQINLDDMIKEVEAETGIPEASAPVTDDTLPSAPKAENCDPVEDTLDTALDGIKDDAKKEQAEIQAEEETSQENFQEQLSELENDPNAEPEFLI